MSGRGAANKPRVTMVDVARKARVAVGTVSHVVNGVVYVSPELRSRVLAAIDELGFMRNVLAQGLRAKQSPIVGLCVPRTRLSFFSDLVDAFEQSASEHRYQIMHVLSPPDARGELEQIKSLMRYSIGGLILVPSIQPMRALDLLRRNGLPTVIVDRPVPRKAGFDQVFVNNQKAMAEMAGRLIAMGHRSILFVVRSRAVIVTRQRIAGLAEACGGAGGKVAAEVIETGSYESFSEAALSAAIRRHSPTAIIASNNIIAAMTIRALRALRIRCPEDVSFLVFDAPEWADIVTPPISTVQLPTREIAATAWELLVRRMSGQAGAPTEIVLDAALEFRESVRPPPRAVALQG